MRLEVLESRHLLAVVLPGSTGLSGSLAGSTSSAAGSVVSPQGNDVAPFAEQANLGFSRFASSADLEGWLINDALDRYRDLFGKPVESWLPVYIDGDGKGDLRLSEVPSENLDHSETNVQVAGVDEGDIVETDGNYLYVLSDQDLVILRSWPAEELRVTSRVAMAGRPIAEYLHGDRLTVISETAGAWLPGPMRLPGGRVGWAAWNGDPKITVTVLDVSDHQAPQVVQTTELEGSLIGSRAVGSQVYVVTHHGFVLPGPELLAADGGVTTPPDVVIPSQPGRGGAVDSSIPPVWPPIDENLVYETREQYLARIAGRVLDLALPNYESLGPDGDPIESGLLSQATDIYQPRRAEDANLASVTVFDMAADAPGPISSVGVPMQYVSTVYASAASIYLLENLWSGDGATTGILKLDRDASSGRVSLSATGEVPGYLLNEFSVDEHDGCLRIATSQGWGEEASNGIYVLRQEGERLTIVGQLTGLGAGEQLYSARFLDHLAFVVTFLRTDPLWTIDLGDPENPQVVGELEIPGFSHYLQSLPGAYLIGIGRAADPATGAWQEPQVSLFDVADPAHAVLIDQFTTDAGPWGWSEAFSDHHAVGYYPEYQVLTLSITASSRWRESPEGAIDYLPPQTDLWVFKIDAPADPGADRTGDIRLLGRITHDSPIRRTVQIEDFLYSISADTISVHPILDPDSEVTHVYYGTNLDELGPVDYVDVAEPDPRPDGAWYAFEATRDGLMVVEGVSKAGSEGLGLTLYDEQLQPLCNSASSGDGQRIEWQAHSGTKYRVRVNSTSASGSGAASFALHVSNLVQQEGDRLTVYGTDGDDRFLLDTAAGAMSVNDVQYPVDWNRIKLTTFEDSGGNDVYRFAARRAKILIVDPAGVDQLDFSPAARPLRLDLNRANGRFQSIDAGGNRLAIRGTIENVVGTPWSDVIFGNSADNRIEGGRGNDRLVGRAGNDYLFGGPGADWLLGLAGDDILVGGQGKDRLEGGRGRDVLVGGAGVDHLDGGRGDDLLVPGAIAHLRQPDALYQVLAAWTSSQNYKTRVAKASQVFDLDSLTLINSSITGFRWPEESRLPYPRQGCAR